MYHIVSCWRLALLHYHHPCNLAVTHARAVDPRTCPHALLYLAVEPCSHYTNLVNLAFEWEISWAVPSNFGEQGRLHPYPLPCKRATLHVKKVGATRFAEDLQKLA